MTTESGQVSVRIDGKEYVVAGKHQTARALLEIAGLPAEGYDLAEIKGPGNLKTYKDDQQVILREGNEFVTVRESAQVA